MRYLHIRGNSRGVGHCTARRVAAIAVYPRRDAECDCGLLELHAKIFSPGEYRRPLA